MNISRRWFHPASVLACAVLAAVLFGLAAGRVRNFSGAGQFILWAYHAPIGFAFVVYGFDRLEQFGRPRPAQALLSLVVIGLALARTVAEIPFYSGHALFIAYMLLTSSSRQARWAALAVLADVLWVKVWLLQDATVWGGLAGGVLFAMLYRRLEKG